MFAGHFAFLAFWSFILSFPYIKGSLSIFLWTGAIKNHNMNTIWICPLFLFFEIGFFIFLAESGTPNFDVSIRQMLRCGQKTIAVVRECYVWLFVLLVAEHCCTVCTVGCQVRIEFWNWLQSEFQFLILIQTCCPQHVRHGFICRVFLHLLPSFPLEETTLKWTKKLESFSILIPHWEIFTKLSFSVVTLRSMTTSKNRRRYPARTANTISINGDCGSGFEDLKWILEETCNTF